MPNPLNLPKGCLFKRRCPYAMPVCDTPPPLRSVGGSHVSRCWLTPEGEPPSIGADAPADVAEAEAQRLSIPAEAGPVGVTAGAPAATAGTAGPAA